MKRILLLALTCITGSALLFAGCNNGSLLSPSASLAPLGKLFAQVALESRLDLSQSFQGGKDRTNNIEDVYAIHLDEISVTLGNVTFPTTAAAALGIFKAHETTGGESTPATSHEEHEEPTSCAFTDSFSSTQEASLLEETELPCVALSEGAYTGVTFDASLLHVTGAAEKDGATYPFELHSDAAQSITVTAEPSMTLDADHHHIIVWVDVKSWFHGVDFALLETVDGVVIFDETHNTQRFEHLVNDHIPESLSLEVEE